WASGPYPQPWSQGDWLSGPYPQPWSQGDQVSGPYPQPWSPGDQVSGPYPQPWSPSDGVALNPQPFPPSPAMEGMATAVRLDPDASSCGRVKVQFSWDRLGQIEASNGCETGLGGSPHRPKPPGVSRNGFTFGVENPTTIGSATGGAGAGKIKFNEFTISKAA